MKLPYFVRSAIFILLCMLAERSFSQATLPSNFQQTVQADYNALPVKEVTYQKYYDYRVDMYMRQSAIAANASVAYNGCDEVNTPCGNGDFESGLNQAEWDGAFGSISASAPNAIPSTMTEGFSAPGLLLSDVNARQTIVGVGNDPITGLSTVAPGGSTKSLRLGNSVNGSGTELISKRITVTASQTIISFQYAAVLQNPSDPNNPHNADQQPTFWVRVIDCATGQELQNVCNLGNNTNMIIANQSTLTNPFFTTIQFNGEPLVFTPWMCAQINLSQHVGKTVCIQFINEDCAFSGHFGYTYLDNICAATNCPTGSITLARNPACGPGQICFNYSLPAANGQTGNVQIALGIYQNGNLLQTINSPVLSSGTSYCFSVTPSSVPGINESLLGYDFIATANFAINGFQLAPIVVGNPPNGQVSGLNNDGLIYCIDQCCPGRNMVRNPGFELGNQYFLSAYNYTGAVSPGSVSTGKYGVLTSSQALTVSPTWDVNCTANGRHLIVNGATGLSGTRIVWSQSVNVERGKNYKFCVDMKNLPQCGFDVKPRVNVLFTLPGFDLTNQVINVPAGACNWQSVSQVITTPAGSGTFAMGITISLDETGIGDGNDLALDNITLVEIPQVANSEVLVNINLINVTASSFGVSATPVSWPVGRGCGYYWEVSEIDANNNNIGTTAVYNPSQWWGAYPNKFVGYNGTSTLSGSNAGVFDITKKYRIIYARWCTCEAWNSTSWIYDPKNGKNAGFVKEEIQMVTPTRSATIMKGGVPTSFQGTENPKADVSKIINEKSSSMRVYPNPVTDKLAVILPAGARGGELSIYNVRGEIVLKAAVNSTDTEKQVNTAKLSPGAYVIQYNGDDGKIVQREKFIKL